MVNQMTSRLMATLATLAALTTSVHSRLSLLSPVSLQSKFLSKYS